MNVTPLDLRQQQFRTTMRGFDKDEVTAFLAEAADDYAEAIREADRLRQEVTRLEGLINEHREHERNLRNTLMTAQRLADEISDNAHKQAGTIIKDAESRAALILEKAQSRYEDVQREIDGLRLKRREVENSVEAVIASLRNTLEFVREQDARDREEKILLHRPRPLDSREVMPGWSQDRKDDGPVVVERHA
ncbi:MAG TPA: DivIVA domain-containing protein [Vicinamibacterales bacterium]|nr:DivIVA domain-containing protein [Vicinamibacterales bacterium]HOQ61060.1 DivIVA domain-containing protein [Vicinamibacterales bacterium]HPK72438.1 DivIVA domain-containing protein [Vicinamibacterales bacterium]HPW20228.1 DivIVA domain-containing protein [Vicinamibacterales bacterium]